jgi:hypothetical protein
MARKLDIKSLAAYTYVFITNFYVQIIGVLLATIWISKERSFQYLDPASLGSSLPFHATTVDPARTYASENTPPSPVNHVEGQPRFDSAVIKNLASLPPIPVDYIHPKESNI